MVLEGSLRSPNFHDGYVKGVRLVGEKALNIDLETVEGLPHVMRCGGLQRFLCDGFAEGNIISHILVLRGVEPPLDSVRRLCGELHPSVKDPHRARHEAWIQGVIEKISTGAKTFVEIVPSYGAEILALCEAISIDPVVKDGDRSA